MPVLHPAPSTKHQAEHYGSWHELLRGALEQVPGVRDADSTTHALLAAIRANLVVHLIDVQKMTPEALRSALTAHIDNVLCNNPDPPGAREEE
ncbi:hypothetical protein AB0H77_29155 [Streptomyces sp. NPDC050844]|uniref:hypothetical protein n=1 Tax=Streptomyces sp. NPDC050844 TaxID=3155790 RepID=UPI0033C20FA5